MCKIIKRLLCVLSIGYIVFVVIAFSSGGERFRSFGEKSEGILKKASELLAEKADGIKNQKDSLVDLINSWTGKDRDSGEKADGKSKEEAEKEKRKPSAKEPADKPVKKKKETKKEDKAVSSDDQDNKSGKKSIGQRLDETVDKIKNLNKN